MKLNKQKATEIRLKYLSRQAEEPKSTNAEIVKDLANFYCVSQRLVYKVLANQVWRTSELDNVKDFSK